MNDWLRQNSWALLIASLTLVSTWTLYGYRISALEAQTDKNSELIASLSDSGVQTQIGIARIQTDIEYIKLQLAKLVN
jgi:uncharacterized coiled-coil protein SlyX